MKMLQGYALKLGDRIGTDAHVSARNHPIGTTGEQLIAEMFRKLDPDLSKRIKKGDFIVAGEFFGTRSTFDDSIEIMRNAGIAAVIQPGGSRKDEDVIAACDEHQIPMIFTGRRHFKH